MSFHSKYGYCIACGAPSCQIQGELDVASSKYYQKTGIIIDTGYIHSSLADFLLYGEANREDSSRILLSDILDNLGMSVRGRKEKCTCGSGYNVLCPIHGTIKI